MRSHALWAAFCFPKVPVLKPSSTVLMNSTGISNKDSKEILLLQWSIFTWAFNQYGGYLYKTRLGFSYACQTPSWLETVTVLDSQGEKHEEKSTLPVP